MSFKPSHVDVLVIGAGPAGSILAATLARNGISTRIVDKRNDGVIAGQADGINKRSMELFQSLGLISKLQEQAGMFRSSNTWGPTENGGIERKAVNDAFHDIKSEFESHALNQGRIERIIQNSARDYGDIEVERGILPISLKIDESLVDDDEAYPVEIVVQHLLDDEASVAQMKAFVKGQDYKPNDGLYRSNIGPTNHTEELLKKVAGRKQTEETIRAKYVVGCDGAWSWTRQQLNIEMEGAASDFIWGVMDIIPITDFPDVRDINMIQSPKGSILWIAREFGLVRLYTQLKEVKPDEDGVVDRSKITPDQIFEQAKKIMQPYNIDYVYCDWWTAYQVGQRVGKAYSDLNQRVFLAGDAVHTHSPKEGQGMNTSMQDAYNLSWKIAAVINKESPRSLLASYESERRPVAQELIEVDRQISAAFSGQFSDELRKLYMKQSLFISGLYITYPPSSIVAADRTTTHASKTNGTNGLNGARPTTPAISPDSPLRLGARPPPHIVTSHTGAVPLSLLAHAPFDGRWHLFVFAGDTRSPPQLARVNALGAALGDPDTGLLRIKHTVHMSRHVPFPYAMNTEAGRAVQARRRSVPLLDVVLVHASTRTENSLSDFHDVFWPLDPNLGREYGKINRDDACWEALGVSRERGALVLLRPDQHVAWMGEMDDVVGLREFWGRSVNL